VAGSLLDTSVVVASPPDVELPSSSAISVVTLGELHAGVALARDHATRDRRRAGLAAVRSAFLALDVDTDVAHRYGDILALARTQGRTAKATDLLVIATAAAHGRTLHTLDVRQARLARAAGLTVSGVAGQES